MKDAHALRRRELDELVRRFTEAFNREDLDEVMGFFAPDAVYEQFDGSESCGAAAIRAAFEPQFRGDFGRIRFAVEDVFVEADDARAGTGKGLVRWLCTLERPDRSGGWRGLDVLHFVDGRVTRKLTYARTAKPLIDPLPSGAPDRPPGSA